MVALVGFGISVVKGGNINGEPETLNNSQQNVHSTITKTQQNVHSATTNTQHNVHLTTKKTQTKYSFNNKNTDGGLKHIGADTKR